MAQIPKETIEKVLESVDIVDLIGSYLQLKRSGSSFKANCPFHHEKTPSFYVNPMRQSFHCFGCGKGGDAISFVRDYENLPFTDAVRKLASRAGIVIIEEASDPMADQARQMRGRLLDLHRETARFFHHHLMRNPAARHARDYLKGRGFGQEMAQRWEIGWMPEQGGEFLEWARQKKFTGRELVASGIAALRDEARPGAGLYVRFRDRLMFPIRNEIGDVIAFSGRQLKTDPNTGKYINSPETAIFRKSHVLFALDRAKKPILAEKAALLCEGQLDVIACHEGGIEHAIAPLGTAFTSQHARLLKRYTGSLVICYDADRAGLAASEKVYREAVMEGLLVRVVEMPQGDDPDTFIKRQGAGAFRELLENAKEFYDFKLERAKREGLLEAPAERARITTECASLLAVMSDHTARDHQINVVAGYLQISSASLREAIAKAGRRPARAYDVVTEQVEKTEPVAMHRIVAFLCHLALHSSTAQHLLGEQFETVHEAAAWLEGVPLLEKILDAAPDPGSPASVNAFLAGLSEPERVALSRESAELAAAPETGMESAEQALALLSATVLQRRDAAVKAALKQPGLGVERMNELLEEAKEISALLKGVPRSEFDDELPPSTWKPKSPPWKKWQGDQAGRKPG